MKISNVKVSRYTLKSLWNISGGLCTQMFYPWIRDNHLFIHTYQIRKQHFENVEKDL